MLDHARFQAQGETLGGCVELVDPDIAPPPSYQYNCVGVNVFHEGFHGSTGAYGACADFFCGKYDL